MITVLIEVTNGKLMGIAVDLSPNYYKYLEPYRILHPESRFGLPGRLNANTNKNNFTNTNINKCTNTSSRINSPSKI